MKFVSSVDIGQLHELPRVAAENEPEKESEEVKGNLLPKVSGYFTRAPFADGRPISFD